MGVPTHRVEIVKSWQGETWANDYMVECPTFADAVTMAELSVDFERSIHETFVHFDYFIVSTVQVGDRVFRHVPLNQNGLSNNGTSNFLPLYCTMRLDMQTADSDPCRKYYRCPIPEVNQDNGVLSTAIRAADDTSFTNYFSLWPEGSKIVSGKGHNVIDGSFFDKVQMRQLHRHRRPKLTP